MCITNVNDFLKKLNKVELLFLKQNSNIRPSSNSGYPGGIIYLDKNIPTIIVPDLHARVYFLDALLNFKLMGTPIIELLKQKAIQIVCVGDGFHAERRARDRWLKAASEYSVGFNSHENIDLEMHESLGLMEMVIDLKISFPEHFHFLKGNHENILNEEVDGNYPFGKFTSEGMIVKEWIHKFCGDDFLYSYSKFEKYLPLFAIGRNFLVSHAEPKEFYNYNLIVDYHDNPEVIYGLTWTRDNQSKKDSVKKMLEFYIDKKEIDKSLYFTGHKTITGMYKLRADDKLVQIHNPDSCNIVFISDKGDINLHSSIISIKVDGDSNE